VRTTVRHFSDATWCLLLGIEEYLDSRLPPLPYAPVDVSKLCKALANPEGSAIPGSQLFEGLTRCSKREVVEMFQRLAASTTADSLVVVYYAGHGVRTGDDFALCFSDTNLDELDATALRGVEVGALLQAIPARGLFFVVDCCHGAGFAEQAPGFFRSIKDAEFRILLSSTRAEERSWERKGEGTVFCRQLLEALAAGDIGEQPGAIYFSELLRYIQDGLNESNAEHPNQTQTAVFAGIYAKDPLLFVNRGVATDRITVRTARYSREYVRRVLARSLGLAAVAVFFAAGTWYTALDHSQYAMPVGQYINVYRGNPRYNAFGFPKLLWETDIPSSALKLATPSGVVLGTTGRGVLAELKQQLKPGYPELVMTWEGRRKEVVEQIRRILSGSRGLDSYQDMAGPASELFIEDAFADNPATASELSQNQPPKILEPGDVSILESFLKDERRAVQFAGIAGLMRIAPETVYQFLNSGKNVDARDLHREILVHLPSSDPVVNGQIIRRILGVTAYRVDDGPLFESALRSNLVLTIPEILLGIDRSPNLEPEAPITYALITGQGENLARAIMEEIRQTRDRARLPRLFWSLGVLPTAGKYTELFSGFHNGDIWVRRSVAFAEVRHEQTTIANLPEDLRTDPWFLSSLRGTKYLNDQVADAALRKLNPSNLDISATRSMLDALLPVLGRESAPLLTKLLAFDDPNDVPAAVQLPALQGLHLLKQEPEAARRFFRSEDDDLAREAYLWYAMKDRAFVVRDVLARIGEETAEFVVDLLLDLGITASEAAPLKQLVRSGNEQAQKRAASILVAVGSVADVKGLLRNPVRAIRQQALSYVALNPAFESLGQMDKSLFPDPVPDAIKGQIGRLREIRALQLKTRADLWPARLEMVLAWNKVSPGMERRLRASQ